MQKPILPNPCSVVGKPFVIFFQVVPPSVDLNKPLSFPFHAPFSQGPCLPAHISAKTMFELFGSIVTWTAPVFSSLYKTLSHVLPPSVVLYTPRSSFGPYGCPSAATKTLFSFLGSISRPPICCASFN